MNFNYDNVGLHLRLEDTLSNLIKQALTFGIKTFQFFLVKQKTERYVSLLSKDKDEFLRLRREHFADIFVHSSYWINPSAGKKETLAISKTLLRREIQLAQALEIEYLVLHAGSSKGHPDLKTDPLGKIQGIDSLAKMLNAVLKKVTSVKVLLENSAHGKRTIGNNLQDFVLIREKLDYPDRVGFCLDTAHAFSYGYNLEPIDRFLADVDSCMGIKNIKLIHFNDTYDAHGSMQDRHAFPGQGSIGITTLEKILHHKDLAAIPKIIEPPAWNEQTLLTAFRNLLKKNPI